MIFDSTSGKGRLFVRLGAISGFLGVATGAFGAHALRDTVSPESLAVWEKSVRYLFVHALALLGTGVVVPWLGTRAASAAGWSFAIGIVLFCGSLFALALGAPRAWGAVTPFGGVAWLAAWSLLAFASWRPRSVTLEAERRAARDSRGGGLATDPPGGD